MPQQNNGNQSALNRLENELETAQQNEDRTLQADALTRMSGEYKNLDKTDHALEYARRALELYQSMKNYKGQGKVLNDLGSIYQLKQDDEQAYQYYIQSMQAREQVKDISGMAETRFNLAVLSLTQKKIREAVMGLLESQFVFLTLGKKTGISQSSRPVVGNQQSAG
ncbi:MAG: hypothetical protein U5R06_02535 [candidate division KSB1 bacterium]|nr:hypothetical protein [candidate division KSB1 bacterium]